jgi:hypothetical protein
MAAGNQRIFSGRSVGAAWQYPKAGLQALRAVGLAAARANAMSAARLTGQYARSLYLPVSTNGQILRGMSRRLRGVQRGQRTNLPVVPWQHIFAENPILIVKPHRNAGGVSLAELAVLAACAASVRHGTEIIEIGTFDGRTTLNFAVNAPAHIRILTLDLPPDVAVKFENAPSERAFVEKPFPGRCFRDPLPAWQGACARIVQLLGDSATFDWSPYHGRAGIVFVDGSHAYDSVMSDSDTAFRLVADQGMIIWHDYGVWEGVTTALERLEATRHLGLRHVRGTSLVVWHGSHMDHAKG